MSSLRSGSILLFAITGCVTDAWVVPPARDASIGDAAMVDGAVGDAPAADGSTADAASPACVGLPWRALRCGFRRYCCAIRCDGSVWCWGYNEDGQLGVGDLAEHHVPTRVAGLPRPATSIATGYDHTCVTLDDGSLWCWGRNASGVLGPSSIPRVMAPMRIESALGPATAVGAGGTHACAVLGDGGLACWGGNERGQLGSDRVGSRSTPAVVARTGSAIAEVTGGQFHTCARRLDGTMACWGQNTFGTLANGAFVDLPTPVEVNLPAGVRAIDTTANHVVAALVDGTVWSWGYNAEGQLGNGSRVTSAVPVQVSATPGEHVAVGAGQNHSCMHDADGTVRCWGANANGELGDGTTVRHVRPTAVTLDAPATAIALGDRFTCALVGDAGIRCWGDNSAGQLGDGTTQSSPTPVSVLVP